MTSSSSSSVFSAKVVNQGCYQGTYCVELSGPASPASGSYGILAQGVSSGTYASGGIRFRAAVRTDGSSGTNVRLWVRVDSGSTVLINSLSDGITATSWARYLVDVPVAAGATRIWFGFLPYGSGRAWVDAASVQGFPSVEDPPRPLSETGLANLIAFSRVLGYVRHFHPSDQAAATDWNLFAIQGAGAVEGAGSPRELAGILQGLFEPIAPTVRIYLGGERPDLPEELKPGSPAGLRVVRWDHFGVRLGSQANIYRSTRLYASAGAAPLEGFISPLEPYEAEIGRGLWASVPLTLYSDEHGSVPYRASPEPPLVFADAGNRATRLAGVMLAWNTIQHFYPYFDVVQTDWPGALKAALTTAATDAGAADYQKTLLRLVAAQKDGHGYVNRTSGGVMARIAPLVWDWVEGQLIVTHLKGEQQEIARGDRVLRIDGRTAEEAIAAQAELVSGATPQWVMWRTLRDLATCGDSGNMELEIEPYGQPGEARTARLQCGTDTSWIEPRPDGVQEIEPGIFYVDINKLSDAAWTRALPSLQAAQGIVFDFRSYPRSTRWLQHLSRTDMTSAQWHIPTPSKPDRVDLSFHRDPGWYLPPLEPYLNARRVFLTDGRAVSYAESEMGIVENYRLGEIVGGPTAGTNGNINYTPLPGGFSVTFTGMKVLKHDGSQHHGIGIQPTIPVSRTRRGIAEGRDEILQRGIEVAKGR